MAQDKELNNARTSGSIILSRNKYFICSLATNTPKNQIITIVNIIIDTPFFYTAKIVIVEDAGIKFKTVLIIFINNTKKYHNLYPASKEIYLPLWANNEDKVIHRML